MCEICLALAGNALTKCLPVLSILSAKKLLNCVLTEAADFVKTEDWGADSRGWCVRRLWAGKELDRGSRGSLLDQRDLGRLAQWGRGRGAGQHSRVLDLILSAEGLHWSFWAVCAVWFDSSHSPPDRSVFCSWWWIQCVSPSSVCLNCHSGNLLRRSLGDARLSSLQSH